MLGTTNARRDGSGGGATERERDGPRAATAGERTAHTRSSQAPRTMSRPLSSWPVSAVPPARVADRTGTCPRRSCWLAFGLVHERSGPPRSTSLRRAAKRIGAASPHVHGRVGRSIGARSRGLGGRCSRWSAVVSTAVRLGSVFFPMLTSVDVSVQIKTEPILTYSMGRARSALVLYLHTLLSGGASAAAVHTLLTSAAAQALPQYILCSPAQQRKRRCSRFFAPSPDPPARQRKCRRGNPPLISEWGPEVGMVRVRDYIGDLVP